MIIFLDMDSTLNDFTAGYVRYYNELYNDNVVLTNEDLVRYEISKALPSISEEEASKIRQEIFSTVGFWKNIPIKENAAEVVKRLYNKYDVFILTAPWNKALNCYTEKVEWVQNHLPFFDTNKIIYTKYKHLVNGDILVDDNPEFLMNNGCKYTIALDYPFNKDVPVIHAKDWLDIENKIEELNGRIN